MAITFTFQDIENDLSYKKFLKKKKGRDVETIKNYLLTLKLFCNFVEKSPTEIHDTREDLRNKAVEFDMWLTDALDNFVSHLIEKTILIKP